MLTNDDITLADVARRFEQSRIYEQVLRQTFMEDYLFMGGRIPTPWERRKRKIKAFLNRFRLAWLALCGVDLIVDE